MVTAKVTLSVYELFMLMRGLEHLPTKNIRQLDIDELFNKLKRKQFKLFEDEKQERIE